MADEAGVNVSAFGFRAPFRAPVHITKYFIVIAAILLAFLYVMTFSGTVKNADCVNGYLIGLDMGAGNWRLSHWRLPADNFWFQDVLAYAAATRLFGVHPFFMNVLPALAWTGVVVSAWTMSRRGRDKNDIAWPMLVVAASLALPILRDNPLMVFITVATDHVVTLLQSLVLLLLADRFLSRGGFLLSGLFLALGVAAVAGDPLAVFIVAMPVAGAALLAGQAPPRRRLIVAAGAIFIVGAGYGLVALNTATGGFTTANDGPYSLRFAAFADLPSNLSFTLQAVLGFWGVDVFGLSVRRGLPQLIRLPMFLLAVWTLTVTIWRLSKAALQFKPALDLGFLDCALALGVAIVVASCLFSSVMVEFWSGRYLLPAFVYAAVLVARQAPRFNARAVVGALALIGSLLAANAYAVNFQPRTLVKTDTPQLTNWLEDHGLPFGYAQYWTAAPINLLGFGKVRVLAVGDDNGRLAPRLYANRDDLYPSPLDSRRPFFVIVDAPGEMGAFKSDAAEATFGQPTETHVVAGFTVDVYRELGAPSAADAAARVGDAAADVVDFKQAAWPGVISSTRGLSHAEPWGTWSDGSATALEFSAPLPEKFAVHLTAQAFGPNVGKEFVARVGDGSVNFRLGAAAEERVLEFSNPTRSRTIEIDIPAPTSPKALGQGGDDRLLGVGLIGLRIAPR